MTSEDVIVREWGPSPISWSVHSLPAQSIEWESWRKKPVIVKAIQVPVAFDVETPEGLMKGQPGDWLIQGIEGEFYPCKHSVFVATYERAEVEP